MGKRTNASLLVLSATAGAGHVRAGEALVETAETLSLPVSIRHEDILNFTTPLFKKLYSEMYFAIVNKSPELWGYLYKKTEFKGTSKGKSPFMKLFDQFNYKKYVSMLKWLNPDAIICTHFLPYAAIADELPTSLLKNPFFSIPTDYDVHSLWVHPHVSHFYVATDEAAWTLRGHGIPTQHINVTGIPIAPQFTNTKNTSSARKEFNISPNVFTIMILSGGYGIGVIDQLVPSTIEFLATVKRKRFHLLIVCGKNKRLFQQLQHVSLPDNVSTTIFEYVSFVDRLMDCADVLITKSGGLTVSEALAKHLPVIIFDPIPGQESRNADYLVERGAAVRAPHFHNIHFKLKNFIERPVLLKTMRSNAKRIAKPDAAQKILEDIISRL